jgi:hypothetical protein
MATHHDTVRARKTAAAAATQRFLPIAEIRSDTVLLKNGGLRAVLEVEAVNFNLKSETEQQGIVAGYGSFVNTLTFPVQIVMRSTRTNIDEYLQGLTDLAEKNTNPLMQNQTLSYVAFIRRLLDIADIMQKRFYVVIPVDRSARKKTLFEQFFEWIHPDDSSGKALMRSRDFQSGLKELTERVDLVQAGLGSIGLHARRLPTRDLLQLYYSIYNPKTSDHAKIPKEGLEKLELEKMTL